MYKKNLNFLIIYYLLLFGFIFAIDETADESKEDANSKESLIRLKRKGGRSSIRSSNSRSYSNSKTLNSTNSTNQSSFPATKASNSIPSYPKYPNSKPITLVSSTNPVSVNQEVHVPKFKTKGAHYLSSFGSSSSYDESFYDFRLPDIIKIFFKFIWYIFIFNCVSIAVLFIFFVCYKFMKLTADEL